MANPRGPAHYGFPTGPTLCGVTGGVRWTTIRHVTCQFCANIIDLFIADQVDNLLAHRQLERIAGEERPHG